MRKLSTVGTLGLLILLLSFASCALPNMPEFSAGERAAAATIGTAPRATTGGPVAFAKSEPAMILQWDPAPGAAAYRVYVRVRPNGPWTLLDEIIATDTPSYEVTRTATGEGSFDFAVSSVDASGTESVKHTSLDDDADPPSGWYVIWES